MRVLDGLLSRARKLGCETYHAPAAQQTAAVFPGPRRNRVRDRTERATMSLRVTQVRGDRDGADYKRYYIYEHAASQPASSRPD